MGCPLSLIPLCEGYEDHVDPVNGLPAVFDTSVWRLWGPLGPCRWATRCLWYPCVKGMMNMWTLQMVYPLSLIPLCAGFDEHMDPWDGLPAWHFYLSVQGMMDLRTMQMGYPLATVTSLCAGYDEHVDPSDGLPDIFDTSVCRVWWTRGPFRWATHCLWYFCVLGMMNTWTLLMGYPLCLSLLPLCVGNDEHLDPADGLPASHFQSAGKQFFYLAYQPVQIPSLSPGEHILASFLPNAPGWQITFS